METKYWQGIEEKIKKNKLTLDNEKIRDALVFSMEAHRGQMRKSGEDYIMHPVEVTEILVDMKMDTDTIIAGILHDVVEDTLITIADIRYNFGDKVAELVDGVTKLKNLPIGTKHQYENLRKMILAMSENLSVVIIKLADRLHNMRTLEHMKPEKQISIARETLDIYAVLANRLGISKIKTELEDLSLKYLKPYEYEELTMLLKNQKEEREFYIKSVMSEIERELKNSGIKADISGRFKHLYSIYKKMYEKEKSFDDIYDLIGIRIITDTKAQCYHILGIIQSKYVPVPGRFKDYISVPKANDYQSIHTTIIGPLGKLIEIQIRTYEMDQVAEEGVAAHWSYKEKGSIAAKNDKVYGVIKGIIESHQGETNTSESFVESFKEEILKENVYVVSPLGDVIELTAGATPLDFAFHIHTDIGCKCVGAKVNGKIVPIDSKLKNGDRVEVITSKNVKGPGNDWLNMVVTTSAKNKIKKWLKEKSFEENSKQGKELVEREMEKLGRTIKEFEEDQTVKKHLEKHSIKSLEDFYYQIFEKRSKLDIIVGKLKSVYEKIKEEEEKILPNIVDINNEKRDKSPKKNDYGIIIDGSNNTLMKFGKCCTPLPGDEIAGYVTKLTGITIHRKDCQSFQSMLKNDNTREVEVNWDQSIIGKKSNKYKFGFTIYAAERPQLLTDIVSIVGNHKINLVSINSSEFEKDGNKISKIKLIIEISDQKDYKQLENNLLRIRDIITIERG